MITRRMFSLGLLAAPAIIRTPGLLMAIKPFFALEDNLSWLQRTMNASLVELLNRDVPLPHSDRGWLMMARLFEGFGHDISTGYEGKL